MLKSLAALALGAGLILSPAGARAADEAAATQPAAEAAADPNMAPLDIKLPKPLFQGTPKNIKAPNLERATGQKRPPFLAPKGAVNLAQGLKVTSSDMEPIIGSLELITDDEKDGEDGYYVELGPGVQWVQLDLGELAEIYAVVVWHFHSTPIVYNDVVVRVAEDADFTQGVKTIYNNDHDNSAGLGAGKDKAYIENNEGRLIDAKGERARYLRFYSNGSTNGEMNHYIEISVYGIPAAKADAAKATAQ
jgi:hypothetical protein